ncbi:MAG: hypothetical protein ABI589_11235 [Burkholderiales bacterium]
MNNARNTFRRAGALAGAACLGLAALVLAPAAQARGNVYWSIGVGSPGVSVGVTNAYPVYTTPAPIYSAPPPVYVQPRPVYVQPRPVYVQPQQIYAPSPVYYSAPVVIRPPVVVLPAPVYPIGWAPRGYNRHHHRHGDRRGPGWRY